jgi:hypothetical protein
MMTPTETIFQNLANLLWPTQFLTAGAPNGTPCFVNPQATMRRIPQRDAISPAILPGIWQIEYEQMVMENAIALPKYELHCLAVVMCEITDGPDAIASTLLNNIRDAVLYQLQQQTLKADGVTVVPLLGGNKQTLGGVVYHARVKGRILLNEGLQNNRSALVFPITILSGM